LLMSFVKKIRVRQPINRAVPARSDRRSGSEQDRAGQKEVCQGQEN